MEEKQEKVKENCRTVYLKNDKYIIELEKGSDSNEDVIKIGFQRSLLSKILVNFKEVKDFLIHISSIISNTNHNDLMKDMAIYPQNYSVDMLEHYFSYDEEYLKYLLKTRETNLIISRSTQRKNMS